ncbi:MAG: hypothetical protein ACTHMP_15080, partial [Thermomicrobiales bacterium]
FTETSLNSLMLPPLFLIRVVQDASTRKGYVSYDQGQTWTQIYSDANTDYITPSHALMFGRFAGAHFLHWEVL